MREKLNANVMSPSVGHETIEGGSSQLLITLLKNAFFF